MDYNKFLEEIKSLILPKLKAIVPQEAYDANPYLTKDIYLETIYSDIMALGYNFNDTQKATDDIYEIQSILHGESQEFYNTVNDRVLETKSKYPTLIDAFSLFHKQSQSGVNPQDAIDNVKAYLNNIGL